ncbi:MAG: FadD3 family acyl-CoA ligase [Polyangiales bacterium]
MSPSEDREHARTPEGCRGDLELGTTPRMLRIAVERHGDRLAIADGEVTLTYRSLAEQVEIGARALMALGICHGDRVAIWAPNLHEWIVAALASQSVGGVLVPINTRFKGAEAAYVLQKSNARVLFTVNGFLGNDYVDLLAQSRASLPALETVVVLRGANPQDSIAWSDFLARANQVTADRARAAASAVTSEDLCDVIFTSGTTGHPKGVLATHGQTLRAFRDWCEIVGLRAGDRYLVVVPFFHSFGYKAGWLAALMMGATIHPQAVFDVDQVLARIERDRITVLPGPPTLYQSILARPDRSARDLSSLRLAVTGAASVPVDLIVRMRRELSFETVLTAYGLTEGTGVTTMCRRGDDPETIATTSGRAIPGVELKVIDASGAECEPGEPGEVLVRGYTVTQGYLDDPVETSKAIDLRGYLHTGDVGVLDAHGNLRITDRMKDMFICGGFNAYPAEIENVLSCHTAIAQVAVVGAPDERLGEVGRAFVVLRPGESLTEAELIAWARERMANYKVPRRVDFVGALPLNATGKVLKYELRARA